MLFFAAEKPGNDNYTSYLTNDSFIQKKKEKCVKNEKIHNLTTPGGPNELTRAHNGCSLFKGHCRASYDAGYGILGR